MSFFKRAVVGALERREEVRDANQLKYESDVTTGITKLNEAEKAMAKNELIVRNRKKTIAPILLEVKRRTGKDVSMALGINAFQKTGQDTDKTIQSLTTMVEAQQPAPITDGTGTDAEIDIGSTRDYTDLSGDTTKALQDASSMISTTSTKLPSQQKSERDYREQRYGGGVTGNIMNTLLGGASGPSVRNAIKERYSSMFRTQEEGDQAYTKAMDYMEELRTTGDPTNIPDLPPEELRQLNMYTNIELKRDKFETGLKTEHKKKMNSIRKIFLAKVTGSNMFNDFNMALSSAADGAKKAQLANLASEISDEEDLLYSKAMDLYNIGGARNATEALNVVLNSKLEGQQTTYRENMIARLTKVAGIPTGSAKAASKDSTLPTNKREQINVGGYTNVNASAIRAEFDNLSPREIIDSNKFPKRTIKGSDDITYRVVTSPTGKVFLFGYDDNTDEPIYKQQ